MHDGSKMVSVAHALGEALGQDSTKYEEAMAQRLERETVDNMTSDALPTSLELRAFEFLYALRAQPGTVYIGTQDHFDWAERNGDEPYPIDEAAALYFINNESWVVSRDEPLKPSVLEDIRSYRKDKAEQAKRFEMTAVDLEDDPWLDFEEDEEDKQPLKRRERKDKKLKDKERTIQRRKQRERKIVYRDESIPLYAYDEDWED